MVDGNAQFAPEVADHLGLNFDFEDMDLSKVTAHYREGFPIPILIRNEGVVCPQGAYQIGDGNALTQASTSGEDSK